MGVDQGDVSSLSGWSHILETRYKRILRLKHASQDTTLVLASEQIVLLGRHS